MRRDECGVFFHSWNPQLTTRCNELAAQVVFQQFCRRKVYQHAERFLDSFQRLERFGLYMQIGPRTWRRTLECAISTEKCERSEFRISFIKMNQLQIFYRHGVVGHGICHTAIRLAFFLKRTATMLPPFSHLHILRLDSLCHGGRKVTMVWQASLSATWGCSCMTGNTIAEGLVSESAKVSGPRVCRKVRVGMPSCNACLKSDHRA